jgi:NAD(P)-dependent dehydrogenase (short-subunit alcohol dehydrogenase family)
MNAENSSRVVVITGASAGVGRTAAYEFAKEGVSIALISRGRAGLEGAKREVERRGGRALVLPADVADATAIEEAAAEVEATFGPIDVWVNDAMTSVFSPVKEMTAAEFKRVTEVTYLGYVYGTPRGTKTDAAAQSWSDHSDRLSAGVSWYPIASGLLRRQSTRSRASATRSAPS